MKTSMKCMIAAAAAAVSLMAVGAVACAETVNPVHGQAVVNGANGEYTARFDVETAFDANGNMTFTPYSLDEYKASEVEALKAGDKIFNFGEEMTVETVEQKDGSYEVNGGFEAGGMTLVPGGSAVAPAGSDASVYYSMDYDDILGRTPDEVMTMPLADQVTVSTFSMQADGEVSAEMTVASMPAAEVQQYLKDLSSPEDENSIDMSGNAKVYVEDGKVTGVEFDWAPNA